MTAIHGSARYCADLAPKAFPLANAQVRGCNPSGYTLIELMVSMATASFIIGGLASSLYIASRGFDQGGMAQRTEADRVLDRFVADAEHALSFSERTATAAAFTVPDRNGDGQPDAIRYAWSGTPGDPLTYEYNGSAPETIAEDVHHFNLTGVTRFMAAPEIPPSEGGGKLLLVVADPANPNAQEVARQSLIESWGYTVTLIDDGDSEANFDAAVAENDVAYVSTTANSGSIGLKLTDVTIGVVNEEGELVDELGFSDDKLFKSNHEIDVLDNSHYITETFATGMLTFVSSDQSVHMLNGVYSPELTTLGQTLNTGTDYNPSLVVLGPGDELYSGGNAAGRRVELPWGGGTFDINELTDDGRTIMQRSIAWAAGAGSAGGGPLLFVVSDSANPSSTEIARQTLMESWGYTVTLIDDDATTLELAGAMSTVDVIYISQEITTLGVVGKVKDVAIGVVNEEYLLSNELGFGTGTGSGFYNDINIVNNSHEITSVFNTGPLALFDPTYDIYTGTGFTLASGADVLGETGSITGLMAIESGATLHDGGQAAGRRVLVPWGNDFAALNADGQTLMQRAIEWAAQEVDFGPVAHWMLDETTGTTAIDSTGNGHNGMYENGPTLGESAMFGMGARFDGVNDRVRVPDNSAFSSHASTGLTVAAWVKVHAFNTDGNGQTRQPIISKGYWSDWEWALYIYDDGRAEFTTWQADGSAHSGAISTGVVTRPE